MSKEKLPATASGSNRAKTGDAAAGHAARSGGFEPAGRRPETRAVGVYDRPAQRMKVSLPLVIILILAALASVAAAARFLF